MIARTLLRAIVTNACLAAGSATYAQTLPPPADMKLAHDIYKQFIEIQSGYSTGSTTPVAEAALTEDAHAGIPGAVAAILQPAPAGVEAVEHPDRFA